MYIHDRGHRHPAVNEGDDVSIPPGIEGAVIKHPYAGFTIQSHVKPRFLTCHIGRYLTEEALEHIEHHAKIQSLELQDRYARLLSCVHIYNSWKLVADLISFQDWKGQTNARPSKPGSETTAGRFDPEGPRPVTRSRATKEGSKTSKRGRQDTGEDSQRPAPPRGRGQARHVAGGGRGEVQQEPKEGSRSSRKKRH